MPRLQKWTLWSPRIIQSLDSRCVEAETEARKWKARYDHVKGVNDFLHERLMATEERLLAYEERDRKARQQAEALAASPVHPDCMIGRRPSARARGTDAGSVD